MRLLRILGFGLLALQVAARCGCADQAAEEVQCDLNDAECLCESNYLDRLNRCIFRSGDDCTDREIDRARNQYESTCPSLDEEETTSAEPTTTSRRPLRTSTTASSTSSVDPETTSSSLSPTTRRPIPSSPTSTSESSTSRKPSNTSSPNSSGGDSGLSKAVIGGIAGGVAGFVLLLIAVVIFCTFRKYKKKDQHAEKMRDVDAEGFIEGGRQLRAKSMTLNANDRLYSTQRPLSYALGEYDSGNYRDHEDHQGHSRGMEETPSSTSTMVGGYFNRFSGNYVDDSSQAFSSASYGSNQPPQSYPADSSYRNSMRSVSVPSGGPVYPTASLSYEQYRNQARETAGERTSLIEEENSTPQRSVSAPVPQRISRKPIGGSIPEDGFYDYQAPYGSSSNAPLMGNESGRISR